MLVFAGDGGAPLGDLWSYRPSADSWTELRPGGVQPGRRSGQTAVWDPGHSQMLVYGGYGSSAARPLLAYRPGINQWDAIEPQGTAPSAQGFHSAVWDQVGERMLVFGGVGPSFGLINDLWAFEPSPNAWRRLEPTGEPPPPMLLHRAVWDPDGQEMLVFGGIDPLRGAPMNELWSYRASDNAWRKLSPEPPHPPARLSFGAVWDPVGHQLLVFGGSCGADCFVQDVWSYRSRQNSWIELPSVGERPPGRAGQSAVWDPVGGQVLLFAGAVGATALSDLWAYRPAIYAWSRLLAADRRAFDPLTRHRAAWDDEHQHMFVIDASTSRLFLYRGSDQAFFELSTKSDPWARRQEPSVIWDPADQRLLMFGGAQEARFLNELWAFSPVEERWRLISPIGRSPPGRFRHTAVWNPSQGEMLVFGGYAQGRSLDEVWSYRPATNTWDQHHPVGPSPRPRSDHSAVWDAEHARMLVFGGRSGDVLNDLWAYDPHRRAWQQLRPAGPGPEPRFGTSAVWDADGNRMLIVGGFGGGAPDEVWSFRPAAAKWERLASPGSASPARGAHSAIWDRTRGRLLLLTGHTSGTPNALWSYRPETTSWKLAVAIPPKPTARHGHSVVWDEARRWLLLFGGSRGSSAFLNDLWAYRAETAGWQALEPAGIRPPARRNHGAAWDPRLQRMYVFGGYGESGWLDDLWAFDQIEGYWRELAVTGPRPAAREEPAAVWDPATRRMLVLGGTTDGRAFADLWAFDPAASLWTELEPEGPRPAARFRHTAVWDSGARSTLIFGGYGGAFPGQYLGDVWAYSPESNTWNELVSGTSGPPARARHAAAWDPKQRRMLVFGGYAGGVDYLSDLWQFEPERIQWTQLPAAGPGPRAGHGAAWDTAGGGLFVLGGQASGLYDEFWLYHEPQ